MYCHRLNHQMVIESYPLPRIFNRMQKLEGFQWAIAFDIRMRYYNIRLFPESQDIMMIATEFGKIIYNPLPMYICALVDIL